MDGLPMSLHMDGSMEARITLGLVHTMTHHDTNGGICYKGNLLTIIDSIHGIKTWPAF